MTIVHYLRAACICVGAVTSAVGVGNTPLVAQDNPTQAIPGGPSGVVPVPEMDQLYSSPTPVETIIVDKNGNMTEAQYTYDPDQGGVVINNYDEVAGPGASLFFPAMSIGMLWWGGYWADHEGYYWNGRNYARVNDAHWNDNWGQYWKGNWNNKWNQYREQHPDAQNRYRRDGGTFQHHQGMNRPGYEPRGGRGARGGGGGRR